jgi:hypothetical protein
MSTSEFQRLTLIAAGVDPSQIPPVLDTATWRRLLISAIANSGGGGGGSVSWDSVTGKPSEFNPSAHASTHAVGGSDPLTPSAIGVEYVYTASHGSFNPAAGGQTYYFGVPYDLAPVTTTGRAIRFARAGNIKAASLVVAVGGTVAVGPGSDPVINLINKTTNASSNIFTGISYASAMGSTINQSLDIAVNSSDEYMFQIITPTFTTAPTTVRETLNLYIS